MRLGDHGRTVIMAVPPTAHAIPAFTSSTTLSMLRRSTRRPSPRTGGRDLDPVQRVSAGSIHQLTWPQPCEPKVSL